MKWETTEVATIGPRITEHYKWISGTHISTREREMAIEETWPTARHEPKPTLRSCSDLPENRKFDYRGLRLAQASAHFPSYQQVAQYASWESCHQHHLLKATTR